MDPGYTPSTAVRDGYEPTRNLHQMFGKLQSQVSFSSVLILSDDLQQPGSFERNLVDHFGAASIRLSTDIQTHLVNGFFSDILAVVYLTRRNFRTVINALAVNFNLLAQNNIILLCNETESFLEDLMRMCWQRKLINVIVLMDNFYANLTYYNFSPYPELHLESHILDDDTVLFPDRMADLKGYAIRVLVDNIMPRDFFFTNRQGDTVLGGYCGHLITAFIELHNATMTQPLTNISQVMYHKLPQKYLAEDVIDFFAGLSLLSRPLRGQSYTYECSSWCLMVPNEPTVPTYAHYPMLLTSPAILFMMSMIFVFSSVLSLILRLERNIQLNLIDMVLHEKSIRAVLGQSFIEYPGSSFKMRTVYVSSLFLGLILSTIFVTELGTLLTSPPQERQIHTFEDVLKSSLKVKVFRGEFDEMRSITSVYDKYLDMFEVMASYDEFFQLRASLDRRYAYPVAPSVWNIFQKQQSIFEEVIFRRSKTMCFTRFCNLIFHMNENSVFTRKFNRLILMVHETGLYNHWIQNSLWEMVEAGHFKLVDHHVTRDMEPLTVGSLAWVWGLFGVLVVIDCVVLALEMCWFRFRRVR